MHDEFRRIKICTTCKQAWNILVTTHKGMFVVNMFRMLKLNRHFRLCIMQEDERFDKFYARFSKQPG